MCTRSVLYRTKDAFTLPYFRWPASLPASWWPWTRCSIRSTTTSSRPALSSRYVHSPPVVQVRIITIYAPMIYTAPCIMFLMRADTLRGQVGGGWALEITSFLGPVKWHRSLPFQGPKKSWFSGSTPSNSPRNRFSPIKKITSPAT
jgi:hypothetical protein